MKKNIYLIILFFTILLSYSCSKNTIYENTISIDSISWNSQNIMKFEVEVNDENSFYDIIIETEHTENYRFSNLWLFIDIISPDKNSLKDTFDIILSNYKGENLGSNIWGTESFNKKTLYKSNIKFSKKGKYVFLFQQGMREKKLNNIKSIGLKIKFSK